jgi:glycosyltransferase involved in cell wall biosynthesis
LSGRSVYINWIVTSYTGWGVYGLNLLLHWCRDPDLTPFVSGAFHNNTLALDPLQRLAVSPVLQRSLEFQEKLKAFQNGVATVQAPALNYLDESFVVGTVKHHVRLEGTPTIGVTFFETTQLDPDAVARALKYPLVVTGSTWNTDILRAHGLKSLRLVIQGVDPTLFHPAPRAGFMGDRFLVFSGGKLERRKGQDIVMAAFRRFAEKHPDALLVTAWHSLAKGYASSLDASDLTAPVTFKPSEGGDQSSDIVDVRAWALANGVGPGQILDLGLVSNSQMPMVLREMDVALFTNRAEGGTNLVAMECMACGVPTILSRNTGHLDLIEDDNCFQLVHQGSLEGREAGFGDVPGWGESDVDEVLEQLERVYAHRQEARERGMRGAAFLSQYGWSRTAAQMKDIVVSA